MATADDDPVLTPNVRRIVLFPIRYDDVWRAYKQLRAMSWSVDEVALDADRRDWRDRLTGGERAFVSRVLAFFAASDGIVGENLAASFYGTVQMPEARAFYAEQLSNETVHAEMYSLLIDTLIDDADERDALFDAVQRVPAIAAKARWALAWIDGAHHDELDDALVEPTFSPGGGAVTFGDRLVAFACVEGIFFSSSFCALFWLKKRALMPGVTQSNEFISRDEATHQRFACLLLSKLLPRNRPTAARVRRIVDEAVCVEREFVRDALAGEPLIGINATSMCAYVEFVADRLYAELMVAIGAAPSAPLYGTANPFEWMELMSIERKTNFFERHVTEYARHQTTPLGSTLAIEGEF